jgi:hypothetical protein
MRLRWVYGSLAEHDNRVVATHNANSVVQIQIALRRPGNAIIVARKAGIDPVGASYPKASCRRQRLHAPATSLRRAPARSPRVLPGSIRNAS